MQQQKSLYETIYGSLVGLAIGDALGAPVEGWESQDIETRFGSVKTFLPYEKAPDYHYAFSQKPGSYTDDARMMKFLCEACFVAKGPPLAGDIARVLLQRYFTTESILEKGFLEEYCYKALYGTSKEVFGGQPTNGGIMGIAPLGLITPCDPDSAYANTFSALFFVTGYARNATALAAAMISAACIPNISIEQVVSDSLTAAERFRSHQEGSLWKDWHLYAHVALKSEHLVQKAWELGTRHHDCKSIQKDLHAAVVQEFFADAAESLAIAVGMLACTDGNPYEAIVGAVGFGRDNDSSAAITGAIGGALKGVQAFPKSLLSQSEKVNPTPTCAELASKLCTLVSHSIDKQKSIMQKIDNFACWQESRHESL